MRIEKKQDKKNAEESNKTAREGTAIYMALGPHDHILGFLDLEIATIRNMKISYELLV